MDSNTFDDLLYNLRVLGMIDEGEYISVDSYKNIVSRYSSNWWTTLTSTLRLETFNHTYECLKNVYCIEVPKYLDTITEFEEKNGELKEQCKLKLEDLLHCLKLSVCGVYKLKKIYCISYPSDSKYKGIYDTKFDTILDSYANIQVELIKKLLKKKEEDPLAMPILKRSVTIINDD